MKTINYMSDVPYRMKELWEWVAALYSYDYGDPEPISSLVRKGEPIPEEFINAISDILKGDRRPNKKAVAKLKIPVHEHMKIFVSLSTVLGLINGLKYDAIYPEGKGATGIGAYKGVEPLAVINELNEELRKVIGVAAKEFNVSEETVENLLRRMRDIIRRWPNV